MTTEARLPESFLRGLEADLRALCTDARRKNPQVKDAAERVIVALKEADTTELKMAAADSAAAAFCAACEAPPASTSSSSLSSYVKVVLRAVSSLHKLLAHRAVSSERLSEVLDALHRLAMSCVDDTITLKVLQCLLSLLTVRSYSKALSEEELSRAFSLLFVLKTSRPANSGNPASNALSAISSAAGGGGGTVSTVNSSPDLGVIEQTSKAAFRQASSDLFASAADAAVQTAVRMQVPSGEVIPLEDFPTEARAAYRFFLDLCHAVSGQSLSWLSRLHQHQQTPLSLDLALALEVIDDGLSSSVGLFAAQPVFLDILSKTLCPVIHNLLTSQLDKPSTKALFGLIVTVVTHYWRNLPIESQDLLHALVRICLTNIKQSSPKADSTKWPTVFAMEAIRCVFRSQITDPNAIIDFVREFEMSDWSTSPVSAIVRVASEAMHVSNSLVGKTSVLPTPPITGALKPFAKTITNSSSFLASVSTGVYVQILKAAEFAVEKEASDVAKVLLDSESAGKAVQFMGKLIELHPFSNTKVTPRLADTNIPDPISVLAEGLAGITSASYSCALNSNKTVAFSTLCTVCAATTRHQDERNDVISKHAKRISILYDVLFDVVSKCQESLGRSWISAIEAFEMLDTLIQNVDQAGEKNSPVLKKTTDDLKPKLQKIFVATEYLKWPACHDMISALVQCSRQSMVSLSRRAGSEEIPAKGDVSKADFRVFGILTVETAMLHAFRRPVDSADPMPATLWELLAGHLTSVCSDSSLYALRLFALNSLTRIACEAIVSTEVADIAHEKIVTPFLDLFNSSHGDVRSGSLSSLYTILETQGELLKGEAAWRVVLSILTTAAGSKAFAKAKDHVTTISKDSNGPSGNGIQRPTAISVISGNSGTGVTVTGTGGVVNVSQGDEMISEGFKVVQVIADDFLSSLARNSLPAWLEVLGLYCRQEDNINVALTSIGLLWRTADFLAKEKNEATTEDWLWVEVFHILKQVSMDERPEIRNCAVKTLTGALIAHSMRLSARAWSGCAERALLPLLEEVMKGGSSLFNPSTTSTASPTESNGDVDEYAGTSDENLAMPSLANSTRGSGGTGRNDSQVMWHHSRDTPRKQWNETRVLALSGVAKVLRTAMPRLAVLHDENGRPLFYILTDGGANGLWRKMLRAAGVAAASRDGEVAIAGVSALLEMLGAAGFVVGQNDIDPVQTNQLEKEVEPSDDNYQPDLGSSSSAPASLGGAATTGRTTTSVASSMSWVAGVITGATNMTPTEEVDDSVQNGKTASVGHNQNTDVDEQQTVGSSQVEQATKGTIMLWEAVWSALVEAICGVESSANANMFSSHSTKESMRESSKTMTVIDEAHRAGDDDDDDVDVDGVGEGDNDERLKHFDASAYSNSKSGKNNEISRIVDQKALQMLAEGLIESRSKLSDKFTPGSSRMLLQVLMFLATGPSSYGGNVGNIEMDKHQAYGEQRKRGGSNNPALQTTLSDVQEVTLSGLKALSFGDDVESWNGLLHGLLKIIRGAHRGKHRNRQNRQAYPQHAQQVILIRRVLDIVRTLYNGKYMLAAVKTDQLESLIPVLGRIILARKDIDRYTSRFVTGTDGLNPIRRNNGSVMLAPSSETNAGGNKGGAAEKDEDEANEWTLWKVGCDTLLIAMRQACETINEEMTASMDENNRRSSVTGNGMSASELRENGAGSDKTDSIVSLPSQSSLDLSQEWGTCADVIDQFLFGGSHKSVFGYISNNSTTANVIHTSSKAAYIVMERAQRELYDIKVVACIAHGIEQMQVYPHNHPNITMIESTSRKLIRILARGAAEGESMGRRKFVRICQACLFSLSQQTRVRKEQQQRGDPQTPDLVESECGRSVVDTCAGVLSKYIADGARAGKCPLPAARRAEVVFLLRQLIQMVRNDDVHDAWTEQVAGPGRKRVLALYPRLCECVESGDETVRLLARDLLDETSPKIGGGTTSNTSSSIGGALLLPPPLKMLK